MMTGRCHHPCESGRIANIAVSGVARFRRFPYQSGSDRSDCNEVQHDPNLERVL